MNEPITKAQERALVALAGKRLTAAREATGIQTPITRLSKRQAWLLIDHASGEAGR